MADAFVYMFIVGAGATSGAAVVGLATFKIFNWMQREKPGKAKRKRGIA